METAFFLKGLILGFSIAAPVGPIGILCIRRTLASGMLNGFVSGLGTATADAVYGSLAAFGVTVVAGFLLDQQIYLRLVGGAFLCYLGVSAFCSAPAMREAQTKGNGLLQAYTTAFFLTITNPMTILSFAAIFAGLGIGATGGNKILAGVMVLGVFGGSAIWWLILSGAANFLRAKLDYRHLRAINRLAGVIIFSFGVACFLSLSY